ncbi:MAG TPA: hypothetical protein VFJ43_16620, partial [Bacteroidia bacterium]|nr:hypothetical protein [Bacteroidia bacterium]
YTQNVIKEWRFANQAKIPNLLLIEKGIRIAPGVKAIIFDRQNPNDAINQLLKLHNKPLPQYAATHNADLKKALSVGAIAIGIAGLIALLANED